MNTLEYINTHVRPWLDGVDFCKLISAIIIYVPSYTGRGDIDLGAYPIGVGMALSCPHNIL